MATPSIIRMGKNRRLAGAARAETHETSDFTSRHKPYGDVDSHAGSSASL